MLDQYNTLKVLIFFPLSEINLGTILAKKLLQMHIVFKIYQKIGLCTLDILLYRFRLFFHPYLNKHSDIHYNDSMFMHIAFKISQKFRLFTINILLDKFFIFFSRYQTPP